MPTTTASTKRAQPVQMRKAVVAVDVVGMPGGRRDPAIQRLPDLSDDDHAVLSARSERAEQVLPRVR